MSTKDKNKSGLKKYSARFGNLKSITIEAKDLHSANRKAHSIAKEMKSILIKVTPLLSIFLFILFCSFQNQPETTPIKFNWHTIVALLAGVYEVIVRLIPTVNNLSWLAKIIDILKWLSDFLNNKKK